MKLALALAAGVALPASAQQFDAEYIDSQVAAHVYYHGAATNDLVLGNGRARILFGGDGDDFISPDIVNCIGSDRPQLTTVYGGVSLPGGTDPVTGRLHPDAVMSGRPGAIGGLDDDGADTINIGACIEGKGGSGPDLYWVHGPIDTSDTRLWALIPTFAVGDGDRILCAHPDGIRVSHIVMDYPLDPNVGFIRSFRLHCDGFNRGRVPIQHILVGTADDGRGPGINHWMRVSVPGRRATLADAQAYLMGAPFIVRGAAR